MEEETNNLGFSVHKKNKINWRSFVALYMGFSFVMMLITGIVLYIAPPGRIAHWTNWKFLGFTKSEWQALHTLFSFVWVVFAIYHIIFNWKALVNYFRRKAKATVRLRKEFSLASMLTIIVFAGTYFQIPPFSTVMDLGEYVTNSWATESNEPPIPHAELLTLQEFAKVIKMPYTKMIKELQANNLEINDTSMTLQKIAKANNISPDKIFLILKVENKLGSSKSKYLPGSGFGRKMLSEIFKENNIDWENGIKLLDRHGIEVEQDAELKAIAENNGVTPLQIIKILNLD